MGIDSISGNCGIALVDQDKNVVSSQEAPAKTLTNDPEELLHIYQQKLPERIEGLIANNDVSAIAVPMGPGFGKTLVMDYVIELSL